MHILITDDEPLIHASIEFCINECGFDNIHISHCYTGKELLSTLQTRFFDLVLVDIRMPGLSGLEAISKAKEISPDSVYYIVSSYSEFDYAREAIKLGVADYLLKPLDTETLKKVIEKTIEARRARKEQTKLNFRTWLSSLFTEPIPSAYNTDYYSTVTFITNDSPKKENLYYDDFMFFEEGSVASVSFPHKDGILIMSYSRKYSKILDIIKKTKNMIISSGYTLFSTEISNDPAVLGNQVIKIVDNSLYRVAYGISKQYNYLFEPDEKYKELSDLLIDLKSSIMDSSYSSYLSLTKKLAGSLNSGLSNDKNNCIRKYLSTITMKDFSSIPSLTEALDTYGKTILATQPNNSKADIIVEYINSNYADNISLSLLAEQFNLSGNYIGLLVKEKTGMKFTDYLSSLRLEKAKELLATTSLSVKEITERIGYYSQSHLNKTFFENFGCTPIEYRTKKRG